MARSSHLLELHVHSSRFAVTHVLYAERFPPGIYVVPDYDFHFHEVQALWYARHFLTKVFSECNLRPVGELGGKYLAVEDRVPQLLELSLCAQRGVLTTCVGCSRNLYTKPYLTVSELCQSCAEKGT